MFAETGKIQKMAGFLNGHGREERGEERMRGVGKNRVRSQKSSWAGLGWCEGRPGLQRGSCRVPSTRSAYRAYRAYPVQQSDC